MLKADEIKVLTIDGVPYAVDSMSDVVREMVAIFNHWSQREMEARDDVKVIVAAKQDLSRQIIMQIRQEHAAAAKEKAEAEKAKKAKDRSKKKVASPGSAELAPADIQNPSSDVEPETE